VPTRKTTVTLAIPCRIIPARTPSLMQPAFAALMSGNGALIKPSRGLLLVRELGCGSAL
jgi:hypothetical protein